MFLLLLALVLVVGLRLLTLRPHASPTGTVTAPAARRAWRRRVGQQAGGCAGGNGPRRSRRRRRRLRPTVTLLTFGGVMRSRRATAATSAFSLALLA